MGHTLFLVEPKQVEGLPIWEPPSDEGAGTAADPTAGGQGGGWACICTHHHDERRLLNSSVVSSFHRPITKHVFPSVTP